MAIGHRKKLSAAMDQIVPCSRQTTKSMCDHAPIWIGEAEPYEMLAFEPPTGNSAQICRRSTLRNITAHIFDLSIAIIRSGSRGKDRYRFLEKFAGNEPAPTEILICLRLACYVAAVGGLLLAALQPVSAQDITSINYFNLSNDGKLLAFATQGGVGLYDWRAGTITKIEDPPGDHTATLPAFATDGKSFHMGFQRGGRYGLFDLSSLQLKATYSNECPASARPVLQQGDKAALTIVATFPNKLCLFDFETKSIRIVLPEAEGFSSVRNPSFVGLDEILFIGQGTRNRELTTKIKAFGADPVTTDIPYRLKFGGQPEIAFPEILERSRALMSPLGPEGPTGMVASRNGEKIVYIDRSLSEEARKEEARKHPKKYGEPHRYDLFVIDHGITRQVTHLEAYMSFEAVSYDGSTAALGLSIGPMTKEKYLNRPSRAFEPVIVDMNTGAITRTDLVARVNADPRFSAANTK